MEKRYIPTTSLNFNNVLSSESISPKAFYQKRGFGYVRWFSIPENNIENVILLYKSLSSFVREMGDMEDHPLLIEVYLEEDVLSSLKPINENVDCCDHTIYLTPWSTRFIFFSEHDKKVALSLSESSLETKLVRLYLKHIVVEHPNQQYEILPNLFQFRLSEQWLEFDKRINKMKGFLYGYYIGALLSTSSNSVKRLNILRKIQNVYAAVLSDEVQQLTEKQHNDLELLYNELWKGTELYKNLKRLLQLEDGMLFQVRSLFVEDGYKKEQDLFSGEHFKTGKLQHNDMLSLEKYIEKEESQTKREQNILSPEDSEIVVIDRKLENISDHIIPNETDREVFKMWINEILSLPQYNGKISTFKEDLSDQVTIAAKNVYGEKWTNSVACAFLNSLRRHVRGGDFDQSWNNGIYSSLAAVITNGNDWTQLLRFMQQKGMYDYRLAFAIYGTLNGFANLSRDFTDILYLCDRRYVESVYKEFYGQLFGKSIREYCEGKVDNNAYCVTSYPQLFETLFCDEVFCSMKNEAKQYYRKQVLQLYKGKIDKSFWDSVKQLEAYSRTKKKWQKITMNWQNALEVSQMKKGKGDGPNLFSHIEDPERRFILSLDSIKGLPDNVIERLIDSFRYSRKPSRVDHIQYFCNICKNEGKGEKSDGTEVKDWGLRGVYTSELNMKIKEEIESRYDEYLRLLNQ